MDGWNVYIAATLLSLLLIYYLTRKLGSLNWRLLGLFSLAFVLLTPALVPGSVDLAPAWVVAAFEYLLGSPASATRALLPPLIILGAFFAALGGLSYFRRRKN